MLRGDITVAIRNAVMHELAEVGYGRLSIEAVARTPVSDDYLDRLTDAVTAALRAG